MATTQELYDEATTAYHQLMTGQQTRVYVDQNGERIEYAIANASRLWAYIQELASKLDKPTVMKPMRPFF